MEITTPVFTSDFELFKQVINQGIDSHLEAFTKSRFYQEGDRYHFDFDKSEVHILIRRLEGIGTDDALSWSDDIQNYYSEKTDHNVDR